MGNKVDILVHQAPIEITFECPLCENEVDLDYIDFCGIAGEPSEWTCARFNCPECGKELELNSNEWL
jgi:endogenous inhibitor of DNA gyrase (YacG/DUF329 family)